MDKDELQILITRYKEHKQRSWGVKAAKNNDYYFRLLLEFIGDIYNRDELIKFFNHLKDTGKAETTRRQAEIAISGFTDWLFYEDIIPKKWTLNIARTQVHRKAKILPSQTEVLELIKQVTEPGKYDNILTRFSKNEHRWCLIFIVTCAGTRNFETREIRLNDVSISGRQILIRQGKNRPRTIPIAPIPWLIEELERRVKGRTPEEIHAIKDRKHYKEDNSDKLFVVNEKRLEDIMREVGKRWGNPLNVHDLRRICLTDLKRNGAGIDDIQHVAGHKSSDTTMKYIEYSTDETEKTIKNYSTTARQFRTLEEKAKEIINHAWERGRIIEGGDLKGDILSLKIKLI